MKIDYNIVISNYLYILLNYIPLIILFLLKSKIGKILIWKFINFI
jgi:hypothetical protein